MAITYSLGPNPKWYIANLAGLPLGGGFMATMRSLNKTQIKLVFEDNQGINPWPYDLIPNQGGLTGIRFDENGSQGPFWFTFDSLNPMETYYLAVFDSNGNPQWTIDNFTPGGGGGSIITSAADLTQLIVNTAMWRNIGSTAIPSTVATRLAPGAHAALANNFANAAGLYTGPDIYFIKNNTSATDTISFPLFVLGSTPFSPDITPVDYFNYTCTGAGAGETIKCVQFPITHSIQNLSGSAFSGAIWARGNSGTTRLTLQWFQFTGDGAAHASAITPITTIDLSASLGAWNQYPINGTIPDVTSLTPLGGCGNDALFLQVCYPLGVTCNIDFTKLTIYVGNVAPTVYYQNYDMVDGVINAPRTGFITSGYDLTPPPGYLLMDDGTIGSSASAATSNGALGKGKQVFPLYNWLYNNVTKPSLNTLCPVVGYTGDAVTDFNANRVLTLQAMLGRAL